MKFLQFFTKICGNSTKANWIFSFPLQFTKEHLFKLQEVGGSGISSSLLPAHKWTMYFDPNIPKYLLFVPWEMWWKIGERKNDSLLTNSRPNNMDSVNRQNELLPFFKLLSKNISDRCYEYLSEYLDLVVGN